MFLLQLLLICLGVYILFDRFERIGSMTFMITLVPFLCLLYNHLEYLIKYNVHIPLKD